MLITSNGSRDLPPPFLRRCIVLAMKLPVDGLEHWLVRRARAHFSEAQCADPVPQQAAALMARERDRARLAGRYVPGVAEYLDLLEAVVSLAPGASADVQWTLVQSMAPSVTSAKGEANPE